MPDTPTVPGPIRPATRIPFSVVRGGLLFTLMMRIGLITPTSSRLRLRVSLLILLTFVPMAVMAAIDGTAFQGRVTIPYFLDLTVWARFFLAMPMLVMAAPLVDRALGRVVNGLATTGVLPEEERPRFDELLAQVARRRDSLLPELVLLVLAFLFARVTTGAGYDHLVSSWHNPTPGADAPLSPAGFWLRWVAMPIGTFILGRWLWRGIIWTSFLRQVSRLRLTLLPAHPDAAGGLGFMGEMQTYWGLVIVPLAIITGARAAAVVLHGGWSFETTRLTMAAFAVSAVLIVFGPLLAFFMKLYHAREEGILDYTRVAERYMRGFDQKWVQGVRPPDEEILGSADVQSMADMGGTFELIRAMRPVPFDLRNVIVIAAAAVLPMVPFLAAIMPVDELLEKVFRLVTG